MGEKIKIFIDYGKWEDQTGQTKDNIIKRLTKEIEALADWIKNNSGYIDTLEKRIKILELKPQIDFSSIH